MAWATVTGTLGFRKVSGSLQWCILPKGEWDDRFVGVQEVASIFEVPDPEDLKIIQKGFLELKTKEAQQNFDSHISRASEASGIPSLPPLTERN